MVIYYVIIFHYKLLKLKNVIGIVIKLYIYIFICLDSMY